MRIEVLYELIQKYGQNATFVEIMEIISSK